MSKAQSLNMVFWKRISVWEFSDLEMLTGDIVAAWLK